MTRLYSERMMTYPRYAIYYVPSPESELYRFGATMLGYDAYSGSLWSPSENMVRAIPDWHELTQSPRQYGFHATLKAPMFLTPDKSEADLVAACERFARSTRAIPVIKPVIKSISGFIAIVPGDPSPELADLAADCVRTFDGFRAPMTAEDRARRNPTALSARQIGHLDRWGYPYVMEDFRFHMTLTGNIPIERHEQILPLLHDRFVALDLETLPIDRIALFRQDGSGSRFRIVTSFAPAASR
jgi:putative phosphonate metabolism protein